MALKDRITELVAWVQGLKVVRVFLRYGVDRGPILAGGMAYQALFAVFAGLWVGFSIAGLVISGDSVLQDSIFDALAQAVPGLIDDGSGTTGAIDPADLPSGPTFGLAGIVAFVGLLLTALGWLGAARDSIRTLFDLPPVVANPVLQKLTDLALGVAFAVLLLLAAGLSFAGTSLTRVIFDALGIADDSVVGIVVSRLVTLVIAVVVYALALAGLYRVLARVRIPWRLLRGGVLIGAIGLAALTIAGGLLLGGASNNPLIASFAVVAGLLIYYNFVSQVILLAASWMAVGADDEGLVLDEKVFAVRLERARELVKAHEPAPAPQKRGFWDRLLRRTPRVTSDG